ncbi:MAG: ankyrin repeat domain-containing protein [Mariprofundales bacterium]
MIKKRVMMSLVSVLLAVPVAMNHADAAESVSLCAMASQGKLDELKRAVRQGADITHCSWSERVTPLFLAASNGKNNTAKFLFHRDPNIKSKAYQSYILGGAIRGSMLWLVKSLVYKGVDVNATINSSGERPMEIARDVHTARYLLRHGAKVDIPERSFLCNVALGNNISLASLYLSHGAIANKRCNKAGQTPIMAMAYLPGNSPNFTEMAKLLIRNGAKPGTFVDSSGATALHVAAMTGRVDLIQVLLDAGMNVDVKDNAGDTPLHYAARGLYPEAVRLLVAHGATVNRRNNHGKSPLNDCINSAYSMNVNKQSPEDLAKLGSSTIEIVSSIRSKLLEVCSTLLKLGATPDADQLKSIRDDAVLYQIITH